jgi:hypothetical protein
MKRVGISYVLAATLAICCGYFGPAQAQASRTWVSGVGDDANPCSRTAPCKTFAGAISKTADGGEISVLDPGGFGTLTINKNISIVSDGAEGSILAAGTTGINVNSPVTVYLYNIKIEGDISGLKGISVNAGATVHLDHCLIRGFKASTGYGIDVSPTALAHVFIQDTSIADNLIGVHGNSTSGAVAINIENSHIANNTQKGIQMNGAAAIATLYGSTIEGNPTGLEVLSGGQIKSYGNNVISNGNPTAVLPQQ